MTVLAKDEVIAVAGAGAMGAGIAQVAAMAGHSVLLFDAASGAIERGLRMIGTSLDTLVAKRRLSRADADHAMERIVPVDRLDRFAEASLCIEAIVEDLAAKQALFCDIERLVTQDAVLATNTSSLSITAIGHALKRPDRLVGMHFFNPAPVMKLVEVISGAATSLTIAQTVFDMARDWGKIPVHAKSTPGFIVNRVARPFYAEALRLLEEGVASVATIDALMTGGGGFRMGPFALMDLIGHDVNYAVTRSVFEAYFNEPRFRPSLLQKELVDAGWLGRKSGRGFYDYAEGVTRPPAEIEPLVEPAIDCALTFPFIDGTCEIDGVKVMRTDGRTATEHALDCGSPVVVYDLLHEDAAATFVAVAASPDVDDAAFHRVVSVFQASGKSVSRVSDSPGLIVMRTVSMLVNEAYEAALQQVASPEAIDLAMRYGVNFSPGPFEWAEKLGPTTVLSVIDALFASTGDPRYRASFGLRKAMLQEQVGFSRRKS